MKQHHTASLIIGIFLGAFIVSVAWMYNAEIEMYEEAFDMSTAPRTQVLEGKAYMLDGWMTNVRITLRTKEDLSDEFLQMEAREFIGKVTAQYTSEQFDEMALKFKEDTIRYLGLPCTSMFVNVSTTVPE